LTKSVYSTALRSNATARETRKMLKNPSRSSLGPERLSSLGVRFRVIFLFCRKDDNYLYSGLHHQNLLFRNLKCRCGQTAGPSLHFPSGFLERCLRSPLGPQPPCARRFKFVCVFPFRASSSRETRLAGDCLLKATLTNLKSSRMGGLWPE